MGLKLKSDSSTTKLGQAGDSLVAYTERDRNMPVLSDAAKSPAQAVAGMGKIVSGDFKGGAKDLWSSAKAGLPWNSMAGFNKPPDPTYLGGSPDALAKRREQQIQGIAQGAQTQQAGLGMAQTGAEMIGDASVQAGSDRASAQGMAYDGADIGQAGLGSQNKTIGAMLATARHQGPSAAEAQMRMGLDQSQQAMMAQAASARGGNQAAAMRGAQANGAQMAGQVNQQAGMLRAQEQAQHQAQLLGAQQAAAGMYGNQAGLGYGMYGQGLGMAQASTGQQAGMGANVGSIGLGAANVGLGSQGQFLTAQSSADKSQLEADTQRSSAKKGAQGGLLGVAGKVIGGLFGG